MRMPFKNQTKTQNHVPADTAPKQLKNHPQNVQETVVVVKVPNLLPPENVHKAALKKQAIPVAVHQVADVVQVLENQTNHQPLNLMNQYEEVVVV